MATRIPKLVSVDAIYFSGNVRTPECEQIPAMVESLRRHGWKDNHPLLLSEKTGDDAPRYLVLVGNRRGMGLQWLRDNEPETYSRVLAGGKVPAIVHKGLTVEEETELRIDHSPDEDRVPLDEWSQYMAIRQLVAAGIDTQERIAIKLGLFISRGKKAGQPNRSYVQVRVNLARLPEFVQKEYRKLTLNKDTTCVRWANVAALYKAYNEEYLQGNMEGNGPEFQKVWQKIITPPEATDIPEEGTQAEPKELSPAEAVKRSQSASSRGLKTALLVITRQSTADLSAIDASMVEGETAIQTLADIADYLGEKDYAALVDSSAKQATDRRQHEAQQAEEAQTEEAQVKEAQPVA